MKIGNAPKNTFMPIQIEPQMAEKVNGKVGKPVLIKNDGNVKVYFK